MSYLNQDLTLHRASHTEFNPNCECCSDDSSRLAYQLNDFSKSLGVSVGQLLEGLNKKN